jgi:nucleoside-diphosphate-sugar epimerase
MTDRKTHKTIAVIGGSGFIGSRLVPRLLQAGHTVRIADLQPPDSHAEAWVEASVEEAGSLRGACDGCDVIVNLAAEHRDDVTPVSRYTDVNVQGAKNVCAVARELGIRHQVFASSVAIYGFARGEPDESADPAPFNDYGRTKLQAEGVYREWADEEPDRALSIIRPTVVFGEGNRGNFYNLLRQVASGKFIMVGGGRNHKSIAYVDNVAAFFEFEVDGLQPGVRVANYVDKPDYCMNDLIAQIRTLMGRRPKVGLRVPFAVGLVVGWGLDAVAALTGRKFALSSQRIRKFCANTRFAARAVAASGFEPPVPLPDALAATVRAEFGGTAP